ncbi:hypothetical protein GCM10009706_14510 [Curtobacterium citreum]|uniref:Uncharacterized protein n=1 Tax=Curtobacterium citreum TaxID=2036 RepID=A0ABT2HDI7_9MICO|nr:hypothetical protein [Curtobacterium citreum]MCS6521322.1 hypothetical protein [Curtobacterium citreum]TQJ28180.1 hypothetical protein FB462_2060 [Curtobacterium citreum]GGL77145.1 hypothetical protein GCM10009706_14510 [Curtobacterium citreum]
MSAAKRVAEELNRVLAAQSYGWADGKRWSGRASVAQRLLSGLALSIGEGSFQYAEARFLADTTHVLALTATHVHKAWAEDDETIGTDSWSRSAISKVELTQAPNVFQEGSADHAATALHLTFRSGDTVELGGDGQSQANLRELLHLYPGLLANLS